MRLIDADALYRRVKAECNPYGSPSIGWEDGQRLMEWIDHVPTVAQDINVPGKWVSVKDRLPESGTVCLTYSPKGKMRVAEAFVPSTIPGSTYDPMECWWQTHGGGGPRFVAVTHWMPLPAPPEEVSGDG